MQRKRLDDFNRTDRFTGGIGDRPLCLAMLASKITNAT
jgi:hypothetical protein